MWRDSVVQCRVMQRHRMQCNAMQCNAMQCNAMQCNAMQCNAMQHHTVQLRLRSYSQLLHRHVINMFMCTVHHMKTQHVVVLHTMPYPGISLRVRTRAHAHTHTMHNTYDDDISRMHTHAREVHARVITSASRAPLPFSCSRAKTCLARRRPRAARASRPRRG